MANISLRAYNNQIESLVEQGKNDEAIAHCRHILKFFPKHVETYRLLGKAYLESQRFGDAADIFQRVLSSVPDDFVAHVGMSIIREDEGNLDAAIWHMERAFDVQSSNSAIQEELRRLYGKRDGEEPVRIQLTRGALSRMYAHGHLYPQSIGELRMALAAEPQRMDLQVMLARMYFMDRQRVNATKVASQLLNRLPYCLDANVIISEIFAETNRKSEAETHLLRTHELDPYRQYLSEQAETPEQVPDGAVTLEYLDWHAESAGITTPSTPDWATSLGMEVPAEFDEEDSVPAWLGPSEQVDDDSFAGLREELARSEVAFSNEQELIEPAPLDDPDDDLIPDFMKDAGWTARDPDASDEPPAELPLDSEQDALAGLDMEDLSEAEIPDWLQSIAPKEEPESSKPFSGLADKVPALTEEPEDGSEQDDFIDLPDDVLDSHGDLPGWVQELETEDVPTAPQIVSEDTEFVQEKQPAAEAGSQDTDDADAQVSADLESKDVPDWLEGLTADPPESPEAPAAPAFTPQAKAFEPEPNSEENEQVPGWLEDAGATDKDSAGAEAPLMQNDIPETPDEIPDWLKDLEPATEDTSGQQPEDAPEADSPDDELALPEEEEVSHAEDMEEALDTEILFNQPAATSTVPDWLKSLVEEATEAEDDPLAELSAASAADQEEPESDRPQDPQAETVPTPSQREGEPSFSAADAPLDSSEGLEPGELPDWLGELQSREFDDEETAAADAQLLAQIAGAAEEPAESAVPNWMEDLGEEGLGVAGDSAGAETELEPDEITSWLEKLDESAIREAGLAAESRVQEAADRDEPAKPSEPAPEELTAEPVAEAPEAEAPDQFEELQLGALESPVAGADWDMETGAEDLDGEFVPQAEAEMATQTRSREEEMGDVEIDERFAAAGEPAELAEETDLEAEMAEKEVPDFEDEDAALAWLENLAAKQGAAEEELLTQPEDRSESLPDWLRDMSEEAPAGQPVPVESEGEEEVIPSEAEALDVEAAEAEEELEFVSEQPETVSPDAPTWISEGEPELEAEGRLDLFETEEAGPVEEFEFDAPVEMAEPEALAEAEEPAEEEEDAALAWLENLAVKQGPSEEEPELEAAEPAEDMPEWLQDMATEIGDVVEPVVAEAQEMASAEDEPSAAEEMDAEPALEAAETTAAELEEAEDWLEDVGAEEEVTAEPVAEDQVSPYDDEDLPSWLTESAVSFINKAETEADLPDFPLDLGGEVSELLEEVDEPAEEVVSEEVVDVEAVTSDWVPESEHEPDAAVLQEKVEEAAEAGIEPPDWLREISDEDEVEAMEAVEAEVEAVPEAALEEAEVAEVEPAAELDDSWPAESTPDVTVEEVPVEAAMEEEPELAAVAPETEPVIEVMQAEPVLAADPAALLQSGREALASQQVTEAANYYQQLVDQRESLEEVIIDLSDAVEVRFPVEISLWQLLGDAYMRDNQLQAALDSFTKAEELLR